MKKLKNKVFSTIFTIMTAFVLIITTTMIVRSYAEKKESITKILTNVSRIPSTIGINRDKVNFPSHERNNEQITRRIYLDFTVYTIILDENGNFGEIINHTNNDEIDSYTVENIANAIIDKHMKDFYIGNLFINNYAYSFTSNNTLIIIDIKNLNSILVNELITYLIIIIICEIMILIITYVITKWITIPVKESFDQQKAFVADASHELKTPLAVMIASADAYFNDKDDKWVNNMKNESVRMTKLVKEL